MHIYQANKSKRQTITSRFVIFAYHDALVQDKNSNDNNVKEGKKWHCYVTSNITATPIHEKVSYFQTLKKMAFCF